MGKILYLVLVLNLNAINLLQSCPYLLKKSISNPEDKLVEKITAATFDHFHGNIQLVKATSRPTNLPTIFPSVLPTISNYPGYCQKNGGSVISSNKNGICSIHSAILRDFNASLTSDLKIRSDILGKAIRLAFHDAAEADISSSTDFMGPDGCLSASTDNAGLIESGSAVNTVFEPLWQSYCDKISRADFWALIAKMAIEISDPTGAIYIPYQFGRKDSTNCQAGINRLPNAQLGIGKIGRAHV